MNKLFLFLITLSICNAEPSRQFYRALHIVETHGKLGAIIGDNGAALGPLQIHKPYFIDSRVSGNYSQCSELPFSIKVVSAYLKRYAKTAWETNDIETLARIHNGGPRGASNPRTLKYAQKVMLEVRKQND